MAIYRYWRDEAGGLAAILLDSGGLGRAVRLS